ncbi:MAG: NAD-dependent epimerase/dehydratase family protein [Planctomycetota bacterium]
MSQSSTDTPAPRSGGSRRVAVVGCGFIAEFHLDILAETPGVEVVAVCDAALDRAQAVAKRRGIPHAVASIPELREHGVEVAHLLVPPDLHARLTRELLENGIGAFVEKPLALESEDARELAELAKERGVPLGVNHNAVFAPAFADLLKRVREGEIGQVEHVQITLSVPLRQLDAGDFSHWMFREPRNIVFEQGPHPFAQLNELVGPVRSMQVTRLGTRELNPGQVFHDRWLLAAVAERGTAELYFAFGQSFTRSTLQVIGSDGSLQADLFHDHLEGETKTLWLDFWNSFLAGWRRGGMLRKSSRRVLFNYLKQTLGLGRREDAFFAGMRGSIQAFHAALSSGAAPPADGERGFEVLAWCEAAVRDLPAPKPPLEVPTEAGPPRAGEVCVLGSNGFIGRRLVQRLLDEGRPVTAVVRRFHSLPPVLVEGARDGRVRLIRASLEDAESLARAVEGADAVVHLATGGGDSWEAVERAMVQGTERLAEAALAARVKRFVYVSSTAALYLGHDCGSEVVSDEVGPDPQPGERPLYARGKIAAEKAVLELYKNRGLPVTIVRPAVVMGPGTPIQHSGLGLWVRDNHCVGWGLGDRPCPIVLADDVADALSRLVLHEGRELEGKALNLSARVPLTAAEVVEEWRKRSGRAAHFHPRSLWVSQSMEVGKWLVKRAGGRRDAAYPSYRDLKSRAMWPALGCERAREILGWKPVEDRAELLRRMFAE